MQTRQGLQSESRKAGKYDAVYQRIINVYVGEKRLQISVTEFPLEQARQAHEAIENRKTTGKVVLTVGN